MFEDDEAPVSSIGLYAATIQASQTMGGAPITPGIPPRDRAENVSVAVIHAAVGRPEIRISRRLADYVARQSVATARSLRG